MKTLQVELGDRSYPIYIGTDLIQHPYLFLPHIKGDLCAIVTNETVAPLYLNKLAETLNKVNKKVIPIILPDGEIFKTWETLNLIFDKLLEANADRKTTLIALGGGVIGDMTGFAAASYMRGVDFIQVPTTLLSQVDSSVGGKTGINHPKGKNMIGAFYQPQAVIADMCTLKTLPPKELSAGLAEVIKHGAIADLDYLKEIAELMPRLIACDLEILAEIVQRSCEIKAHVVSQDERGGGLRAILNFGHTFGHAIETGMGYGTWLHGEAVGAGMVLAAELSHQLGYLKSEDVDFLKKVIDSAKLPIKAPKYGSPSMGSVIVIADGIQDPDIDIYMSLMKGDKKAESGQVKYIVLKQLGEAVIQRVADETIRKILKNHLG